MRGVGLMTLIRHDMTAVGLLGYTNAMVSVSTAACEGHAVLPHHHRRWWFPRCIHWVISRFYISWWLRARLSSWRCSQAWCFLRVVGRCHPFVTSVSSPFPIFNVLLGGNEFESWLDYSLP
uniref:Putative secreted protein n=1 Tax=Ixodes ricinus TaxID=34613 RepID=A0A6B0UN55_IXORI